MSKKFRVVGIGEILWDVYPEMKSLGGAPTNCACFCNNFGAEAYIVSAIGNDALGDECLSFMNKHGIKADGLYVSSEYATGTVQVTLSGRGKPEYDIKEDVAWDNIPFTNEMLSIANTTDAVCFGSLAQRSAVSRANIHEFLKHTPCDCLKMFDINIRKQYYSEDIIKTSLKYANALKINDEELPLLAGIANISGSDEDQLKQLVEIFGLKIAILTCGPKGALMVTPDKTSFQPAPDSDDIKSTVGAGDSFTATTVMGLLHKKDLDEINIKANEVATYVCSQMEAAPVLPEYLQKAFS